MHIEDISVRLQNDHNPIRIKPLQSNAQAEIHRRGEVVKDTAQTSMLSRIASDALRQMRDEPAIREDKVAQFKHLASDDAKFSSDDAIDAIFSRMFAM